MTTYGAGGSHGMTSNRAAILKALELHQRSRRDNFMHWRGTAIRPVVDTDVFVELLADLTTPGVTPNQLQTLHDALNAKYAAEAEPDEIFPAIESSGLLNGFSSRFGGVSGQANRIELYQVLALLISTIALIVSMSDQKSEGITPEQLKEIIEHIHNDPTLPSIGP